MAHLFCGGSSSAQIALALQRHQEVAAFQQILDSPAGGGGGGGGGDLSSFAISRPVVLALGKLPNKATRQKLLDSFGPTPFCLSVSSHLPCLCLCLFLLVYVLLLLSNLLRSFSLPFLTQHVINGRPAVTAASGGGKVAGAQLLAKCGALEASLSEAREMVEVAWAELEATEQVRKAIWGGQITMAVLCVLRHFGAVGPRLVPQDHDPGLLHLPRQLSPTGGRAL